VQGKAPDFSGRLCMGDPGHVPAGIYGKQALVALGWWDALEKRVVGTEDVRTALAFVQRGECPLGIVYATDAAVAGDKVRIVGRFPAGSHDPVVYPFA
ncbi:MAG: molybdate ABC transporter substrate-binding protein, partial [Perlucidibaca sp.]